MTVKNMTVDKAIEKLNGYIEKYQKAMIEHGEDADFQEEINIHNGIIALLKSLATRCQDYDALLDELKKEYGDNDLVKVSEGKGTYQGQISKVIEELEKKYLGKK